MDIEEMSRQAMARAEQANEIEQKLRELLADEVGKMDDAPEQILMVAVVAMGFATRAIGHFNEAVEYDDPISTALTAAANHYADRNLGPQLVKLHKLNKAKGK